MDAIVQLDERGRETTTMTMCILDLRRAQADGLVRTCYTLVSIDMDIV